jgi:aminopeptidase-like protein
MRTPHGEYSQYHTSGDNLTFVQPEFLQESYTCCLDALTLLEKNKTFLSQNPNCEPQLGKRGLYRAIGGQSEGAKKEMAILWVLNLSDGQHSVLEMAERSGMPFNVMSEAAETLAQHGLVKEVVC